MDSNIELPHETKEQEHFLKAFIRVYRENQVLWDKSHPKYKNRDARNTAQEILLTKCQEFFSDANLDFVKLKIDGLRTSFRREYRKVLESKKVAKTPDQIYTPTLWYYHLLLFTVGEECEEDLNTTEQNNYQNLYVWPKEHTVMLIELFQKKTILYSSEGALNNAKVKRMKAYNEITTELINRTGRKFELEEVKKKILSLKQQFRREWKLKNHKRTNRSTLWCYELLLFLKDYILKSSDPLVKKEGSDESPDNLFMNGDDDMSMEFENKDGTSFLEKCSDDIFDTLGKNVAIKLRDMSDDQQKYAENLINQLMYHGLMENLTSDSRISLDGL